ncbi:hypothetical protein GSI_12138 [Ganoderma sinense ZZ0214-1]|uniref:Uncharacterized protein n=1 Tax=Ganoderma sinense ZZ0214-1 TaxID=1077348 RepID=A0A2G8RXY8_9APHY|nr:hypothetical protein GSI_12138 [Ganoderma sinense ZZ0214-1]
MTLAEASEGLNLLVVGTIFASFLIPTSVALFTFSPFTIWRSPLFILNVLAIILGLIEQGLYIYVIINTTAFGGVPTFLIIMIVAMDFLVPICVQGILLVRLVSVYPPKSNSRQQNLVIYIPVVAFKVARLVNASYATHDLIGHLPDSLGVIAAAQFIWRTKYVKVEWFLQLFDDMFVSGLFVHKLYASAMMRRGTDTATHSGSGSTYSWAERIRTLYYIALSNFVFPILFNIAEIVMIFTDPNFFHGATVVTVNCYVTIIGVLLATIWAQGSKGGRLRKHAVDYSYDPSTTVLASVEFARPQGGMDEDADEDGDEDEWTRAIPRKGPASRRQDQPPSLLTRGGEHALFKDIDGALDTVDEEAEGKRVSESSSSSAGAAESGPAYNDEKHVLVCSTLPATSTGRRETESHWGDPISNAV